MTVFQSPRNAAVSSAAPILFLAFDVFTHPDPCDKVRLFESLPLIEFVLRLFPELQVVLSGTWRQNHPVEELQDLFSDDIAARLIRGTPSIFAYHPCWYPVPLRERRRQREVEAWFHQNRSSAYPWLAIDDRAHWF